ncbi:MAG: hypothetical protein JXN61_01820 [Sedimentisphaerales bacterium]|nr:hypothetical protein [Sedimentisphaerales bacterium]
MGKAKAITIAAVLLLSGAFAIGGIIVPPTENIDPLEDDSQYAYGENIGWLNFEPSEGPGVTVNESSVSGYVWAQNIGWINLSPAAYGGVFNDGTGVLSGYAWGQNVGWINFNPTVPDDPTHYGVIIDADGNFAGWAWGQNIGWIHFQSAIPVAYKVQTSWVPTGSTPVCVVDFNDLSGFCGAWLEAGAELPWDLSGSGGVDFKDYCVLAGNWLQECPEGWPLED